MQILNTVIGKMSGVVDALLSPKGRGASETDDHIQHIASLTPTLNRAVLVEEFNRILISRISLPGFKRGIEVFIEKDDLLPFEEAKLYGHNAIHALIGYLADLRGLATIAEAGRDAELMRIARSAFINESGAALCRRHAGLNDPLFTSDGYRDYAEDLLTRMIRPNLNDLVARVIRDHVRKLGYDDRFYGTMRVALEQGIQPTNLATGAAAAILSLIRRQPQSRNHLPIPTSPAELTAASLSQLLQAIWSGRLDAHADKLISLTWQGFECLV